MQQPDLEACVIRICDGQGQTRGTGFVVAGGLAVTCAHVVEACGVAPGGCVRVIFHASGEARQAEVLPGFWRPSASDDVAILRLLPPGERLPDDVVPATLGSTRHCSGHRVGVLGFPPLEGGYDVAWAEGKIRGVVPHPTKQPMLQLDARPILPGMSGAPVLDLDAGRVVGVVNEYLKHAPLEWATTGDTLATICPDLQLYPPQAVEEYLAAVAQFCRDLPYVSLRSDVPLEEVYVRQQMRPQFIDTRSEEEIRRALEERAAPLPITEALNQHPCIVVVGGPGAGKSMLLRHLVQQSAAAAPDVNVRAERAKPSGLDSSPAGALLSQHGGSAPCSVALRQQYIPVLVSLRGMAEREGDLTTCLREEIAAELGARLPQSLPDNFLAEWAGQTGATWLIALDGLDEIVDAGRRRELVRELAQAAWPSQAHVIITTRPDEATVPPKDFTPFDLLPFERGQVEEFARRWFRDDEQRTQAFLDALKSVRLGELSGTPLLLTVAATVFEEALKKPGFSEKPGFFAGFRRSRLYDEFVRILLDEDAAPGRRMRAQFREQFGADLGEALFRHRRRMLEWIALALQEEQDVQVALVERLRQPPFSRSDLDVQQDAAGVLEVLACQRAGLVARRGDTYEFIHPTFREYLAAATLVRECRQDLKQVWERGVSRWVDRHWREVALFALGMLSDEGKDVTALVEHIWQAGENGLYFAGMALAERVRVETNLSDEIIDDLIAAARMMSFLDQWSDPDLLIILGELRDYPRAANSFLGLARDEQVWMGVREGATEALDQLRRVDDLLVLMHDEQVDEQIRERAAVALGRLGRVNEAAPFLLALACDEYTDVQVRMDAAATLGELGQADDAVPILLALARDKEGGQVREQAAEALGKLGRADDLLALACCEQVDEWVRERAAEALGQIGLADEATSILLTLARDEKVVWWERKRAATALGRLGQADKIVSVLLALVRDEKADWLKRREATEVLGKLG